MSRYRFIEAQRAAYSVRLLCHVLGMPASGYYAWQQAHRRLLLAALPGVVDSRGHTQHPAELV